MQTGFFDIDERLGLFEKFGDPLLKLQRSVGWKPFGPLRNHAGEKKRKSCAVRKPYDVVSMFKVLVLQHLYNLSDEQIECQVRGLFSLCRFPGLPPEGRVPDARTVWLLRKPLREHERVKPLLDLLIEKARLAAHIAHDRQIMDTSPISAPLQRNSLGENETIKQSETPETRQRELGTMCRQKDVNGRWTKKNAENDFGYVSHVDGDGQHALIRCHDVTTASLHDSQVFDELLEPENSTVDMRANVTYRSIRQEESLESRGYRILIHFQCARDKFLAKRGQRSNASRSKVRHRIEHEAATQEAMGSMLARTIGLAQGRSR